jgi:hypothetical protein
LKDQATPLRTVPKTIVSTFSPILCSQQLSAIPSY